MQIRSSSAGLAHIKCCRGNVRLAASEDGQMFPWGKSPFSLSGVVRIDAPERVTKGPCSQHEVDITLSLDVSLVLCGSFGLGGSRVTMTTSFCQRGTEMLWLQPGTPHYLLRVSSCMYALLTRTYLKSITLAGAYILFSSYRHPR